jgi:hypothetical protein
MKPLILTAALALATGTAAAQTMSGPSLLTDSREAQLERWLGAGDQLFTPLFTGVPGDTSLDFHSAVDGKGPTFTLLQVSNPRILADRRLQPAKLVVDRRLPPHAHGCRAHGLPFQHDRPGRVPPGARHLHPAQPG